MGESAERGIEESKRPRGASEAFTKMSFITTGVSLEYEAASGLPAEYCEFLPKAEFEKCITRQTRNKRKAITTINGLDMFGVKLADAAKKFGKRFACGSSVVKTASNTEEIDVQGDFMDEIGEMICAQYKEITEDDIKYVDKK